MKFVTNTDLQAALTTLRFAFAHGIVQRRMGASTWMKAEPMVVLLDEYRVRPGPQEFWIMINDQTGAYDAHVHSPVSDRPITCPSGWTPRKFREVIDE